MVLGFLVWKPWDIKVYAPPYDYRPECLYRMVSMFAGTYYSNDDQSKKAGMQAIHLNFSNSGTSAPEIVSSLNKLILKIPHI